MGQTIVRKKLGEILIEAGKLDEQSLKKALDKQKTTNMKLGETLIEMQFITEEEMIQSLAIQYQFPYIKIENYNFTPEALGLIPKGLAIKFQCIPMDKIGNFVSFVISDPGTVTELTQQESFLNCKMNFFVTIPSTLKTAIKNLYGA